MIAKRGAREYSGGVGVKNGLLEASEEGLRLALQTERPYQRVACGVAFGSTPTSRVDGMQDRIVRKESDVLVWCHGQEGAGTKTQKSEFRQRASFKRLRNTVRRT